VDGFIGKILIAQYALTALSSGFNAGYFWAYRSPYRKRRLGAVVLAVLSLALLVESVYFGLFALSQGRWWAGFFLAPGNWLAAKSLLCLGSLAISALILRRLLSKGE